MKIQKALSVELSLQELMGIDTLEDVVHAVWAHLRVPGEFRSDNLLSVGKENRLSGFMRSRGGALGCAGLHGAASSFQRIVLLRIRMAPVFRARFPCLSCC